VDYPTTGVVEQSILSSSELIGSYEERKLISSNKYVDLV
jgi:hypothetical protein